MKAQDALNAKVQAVNAAHRAALDLFPRMQQALKPFVGQQIVKADGTLLKKVEKALPPLPQTNSLSCYVSIMSHTLHWHVKACTVTPQGHAYYHDVSLYLSTLQGGYLREVWDTPPELRSDWTPDEVHAKRLAYEAAKKIADDAKSALHPFGEYDR